MHDSLAPWLLLPVKSLSRGKQRLKPALGDRERAQLNEFFLVRMLVAASQYPGLERTAVVSEDADAAGIASSRGARVIRSDGMDLNQALTFGRHKLSSEHDRPLLVLPVDLPFVEPGDIQQISLLGREHATIICPDRNRTGTNAIFFSSRAVFPFRFGHNSFQMHQDEAIRCCGRRPYIHFNSQIALDIDTPPDLALLKGLFPTAPEALSFKSQFEPEIALD